jgi:uncharacterized Zn finger protein
MVITFTCYNGHQSESEIEEMITETRTYYGVLCRCSKCGLMNNIKIAKEKLPNNKHDETPAQKGK